MRMNRIGAVFDGKLIVNEPLPHGVDVHIGSASSCEISIPVEIGLERRLVMTANGELHVEDADIVWIATELSGKRLQLAGNIADKTFGHYKAMHPGLASPLKNLGPHLGLRIPVHEGKVLLVLLKESLT